MSDLNPLIASWFMFSPSLAVFASLSGMLGKAKPNIGLYLILSGVGLVLVHIALAWIIRVSDLFALDPFSSMFIIGLSAIGLVSTLVLGRTMILGRYRLRETQWWAFISLIVIFLGIMVAWCFLAAQGWDSLDSWLVEAVSFIDSSTSGNPASTYFYEQRHPFTTIALTAFGGWVGATVGNESHSLSFFLWAVCYLAIALICFGYALYRRVNPWIGLLLSVAVITTPLLENHLLLFGYADIWLAAGILVPLILLDVGIRSSSRPITMCGIACLGLPMLMKNTGYIFSLVLIAIFLLNYIGSRYWARSLAVIIVLFSVYLGVAFEKSDPHINSVFDIRFDDDELIFFQDPCQDGAFRYRFFLNMTPLNPADIENTVSPWVKSKFPGRDFRLLDVSDLDIEKLGEECRFRVATGSYKKRYIKVGQMDDHNHIKWAGVLVPHATQLSLNGVDFSLQIGTPTVVEAIGKHMIIYPQPLTNIVWNEANALIFNMSYSLWFAVLIFVTGVHMAGRNSLGQSLGLFTSAAWALLSVFALAQVFVDEMYRYSIPGNDTRHSRFLLWFPAVVCLALVSTVKERLDGE